eukprot:tig00000403_g353.t1
MDSARLFACLCPRSKNDRPTPTKAEPSAADDELQRQSSPREEWSPRSGGGLSARSTASEALSAENFYLLAKTVDDLSTKLASISERYQSEIQSLRRASEELRQRLDRETARTAELSRSKDKLEMALVLVEKDLNQEKRHAHEVVARLKAQHKSELARVQRELEQAHLERENMRAKLMTLLKGFDGYREEAATQSAPERGAGTGPSDGGATSATPPPSESDAPSTPRSATRSAQRPRAAHTTGSSRQRKRKSQLAPSHYSTMPAAQSAGRPTLLRAFEAASMEEPATAAAASPQEERPATPLAAQRRASERKQQPRSHRKAGLEEEGYGEGDASPSAVGVPARERALRPLRF